MAKAKDRPASPAKTVKSAGAKNPGTRPAQARSSAKIAPDAPEMDDGMSGARPTQEQLYRMIQETAYFKAKARNFEPGHEVQDWIEAEAEVRMRLENRA
jgi:hypothetical protein